MESKVSLKERIIAIFVTILVIASLVAFSFAVPWTKVHAESVADQFEDYVDNLYGEGSSTLIESIVNATPGLNVVSSVMLGLEFVEVLPAGTPIPVNSITSYQGYYWYKNQKWICNSTFTSATYYSADGNIPMAKSANFDVQGKWRVVNPSRLKVELSNKLIHLGVVGGTGSGKDIYTGGSSIFPAYGSSAGVDMYVAYSSSAPNLSDNLSTWDYFVQGGGYTKDVAGGFSSPRLDWSSMGFGSDVTIDPSNIIDFVLNVFNPWVEETYPDLVVYLFYPESDPTDSTGESGGCHCEVYVYVTEYFDPEINVYVTEYITVTNNVDVDLELPSEWLQDYTFATDPTDLPVPEFPTDPLTTEPVTAPSIDESEMQQYEQEFGDGIRFWLWLTGEFVEKLGLQTICGFVFVIAVAGFVLWKAGGSGGGKDD